MPTLGDLVRHNRLVDHLRKTARTGITFRRGLNWDDLVVVGITDASHGDVDVTVEYEDDETCEREPFRSQGGRLCFL